MDHPSKSASQATLAWGAEGVRVDVYDRGRRTHAWHVTWAQMADLVQKGSSSPTAVAGPGGVEFFVRDTEGETRILTWTWDQLAECAKVKGSPVKEDPA